jgi:hypothetical protein
VRRFHENGNIAIVTYILSVVTLLVKSLRSGNGMNSATIT